MKRHRAEGFTLVEVLVALIIVAMGLAALMVAVSGAARTTGYLRDKTLAEWIGLNRLTEARLNTNKAGSTADKGELQFANRTWHYDTRYFDTSMQSMKRIVVRVYAGDTKTKGNPMAEVTGFLGQSLSAPGNSNIADWTKGTTADTAVNATNTGTAIQSAAPIVTTPTQTTTPTTPAQ